MLNMYHQLPIVLTIFEQWRSATGLTLKGTKCVLIPLFPDFDEVVRWAAALQGIAGAAVSSCGRYLGIEVGPSAHFHQWAAVMQKATSRIGEIRAGGKSLAARIFMYSTYVSSLFACKAQFAPIPPQVFKFYKRCAHHITKTPWQALPATFLADITFCGCPRTSAISLP